VAILDAEIKRIVERATVTFLKSGGRGVLVCDHLIVTATHCIELELDGWLSAMMALDEHYIVEEIKTSEGRVLKTRPIAMEPVADIAVVGALDGQSAGKEAREFDDFCSSRKPVLISQSDFALTKSHDLVYTQVHVYTHREEWVTGKVFQFRPGAELVCFEETSKPIEGGTSGSPIVNDVGELVGIVSNAGGSSSEETRAGRFPRPHLTLPVWVCQRIFEGEDQERR
jgi:V8-like Glu-specific endopeptidase